VSTRRLIQAPRVQGPDGDAAPLRLGPWLNDRSKHITPGRWDNSQHGRIVAKSHSVSDCDHVMTALSVHDSAPCTAALWPWTSDAFEPPRSAEISLLRGGPNIECVDTDSRLWRELATSSSKEEHAAGTAVGDRHIGDAAATKGSAAPTRNPMTVLRVPARHGTNSGMPC